jgi:hypothetical protein
MRETKRGDRWSLKRDDHANELLVVLEERVSWRRQPKLHMKRQEMDGCRRETMV